jgi:3-dehydroquinate synthase
MLPDHIRITAHPDKELIEFLSFKKYSQVVVVADENTCTHCYPLLDKALPPHSLITIQSGEEYKNLETCTYLWRQMTALQLDRHAVIVVLGGGVLGDMAGFCAATYKRGINFILLPTTLLAQADASIGGKLGVDFDHYKNHIGIFQEPALTLLHSGFLKTLPTNELRSGFAEVIKHALISDADLWNEIRKKELNDQQWDRLLKHSAEYKYGIIEQDPTEKGIRKILNAGHTLGHAVESYLLEQNRKIMHGEAVALGLLAEAFLAKERGLLNTELLEGIQTYIQSVFGKVRFEENEIDSIAEKALQDKKNKGKEILCVLLEGPGRAGWDYTISLQDVKRALSFYLAA